MAFAIQSKAFGLPLMARWQALMDDGPAQQAKGNYDNAIRAFSLAATLAEREKLPPKCLPLALCRLTQVEVLSNHYDSAELHFLQLIKLVKAEKEDGILDPEVGVWLVDLSDTYQARQNPKSRESCLKHACQLKALTFGGTHRECLECLSILIHYYLDHGNVDQAVRTLSTLIVLQEKTMGKNPNAACNVLNQEAINYEKQHKYETAKKLGLAALRIAKTTSGVSSAALPTFNAFLGMNAFAQGNTVEGKSHFDQALAECGQVKRNQDKELLGMYLEVLTEATKAEMDKFPVKEATLKHILAMEKLAHLDLRRQYGAFSLLACIHASGQVEDDAACIPLRHAIEIAKLPGSAVEKDLADLYLRLGIYSSNLDASCAAFDQALQFETDKKGFHTGLVLFWWAWKYSYHGQPALAYDKCQSALKTARALPPESRGTLLANSLQLLAPMERDRYGQSAADIVARQSAQELQLQRKLGTKLGPDFYHQL
jgi:hypothetical protein